MQYGAVTLFFALTQAGRAHAREKRKRCEEQRLGNAFGRRGGFVLGDGRSVFERGRACFCRQKRGMKRPGGARRKGKGHDPQARGRGVRGGSVFPPGERLASGSEGQAAFSRPRGIAARRRLVPVRVHVGHSRRAGAFSSGEAMFTRRCRVRASCAKAKRVDCRKTAGECALCGASGPGRRTPPKA